MRSLRYGRMCPCVGMDHVPVCLLGSSVCVDEERRKIEREGGEREKDRERGGRQTETEAERERDRESQSV